MTWSSSNASVASVTGTGYVAAVKAGTATITASAGGKSASVRVTVTDPSVAKRPMDVWYKPASSSVSVVRVWYRLLSSNTTGHVDLKPGCDGYFTGVIPDAKGERVKLVVDLSTGSRCEGPVRLVGVGFRGDVERGDGWPVGRLPRMRGVHGVRDLGFGGVRWRVVAGEGRYGPVVGGACAVWRVHGDVVV